MALKLRSPIFSRSKILSAVAIVLAAGIFVGDSVTEADVDVAVLYVTVVLIANYVCSRRGLLLVGLGCIALTLASLPFSPDEDPFTLNSLANTGLAIAAIAAVTFITIKNRDTEDQLAQSRAQLAHVDRVTTLGEITASIAHEVSQPLAAITTNGQAGLRFLGRDPPDLGEARDALKRMVAEGQRAAQIVQQIRGFTKKTTADPAALDLNAAIGDSIALVQREIAKRGVLLRQELASPLPGIVGDRIQLQQVMVNLIMNGLDALEPVNGRPRELVIRSAKDGVGHVMVSVQDSGVGIEAEASDRLFDAFYTTKPNGMGLGLSICRTIIEAHGGQMWASSNSGPGTTLQFRLPLAP